MGPASEMRHPGPKDNRRRDRLRLGSRQKCHGRPNPDPDQRSREQSREAFDVDRSVPGQHAKPINDEAVAE